MKRHLIPEPEWINNMLKLLTESNSETEKVLRRYRTLYMSKYAGREPARPRQYDLSFKTQRARNYEKYPAANPLVRATTIGPTDSFDKLHCRPEILFDLENPYFDANENIEDRMKIIHSCIVIQKAVLEKKEKRLKKVAGVVQKYVRVFLAKIVVFNAQILGFRRAFLLGRLRHWYPLAANKWRMHKHPFVPVSYLPFTLGIVLIQKTVRGFIARKNFKWKKHFNTIKKKKVELSFFKKKQIFWKVSYGYEWTGLNASQKIFEEVLGHKAKMGSDNRDSVELLNKLQRTEIQSRKEYLYRARIKRLECYD